MGAVAAAGLDAICTSHGAHVTGFHPGSAPPPPPPVVVAVVVPDPLDADGPVEVELAAPPAPLAAAATPLAGGEEQPPPLHAKSVSRGVMPAK
jgi:hypothetical protein